MQFKYHEMRIEILSEIVNNCNKNAIVSYYNKSSFNGKETNLWVLGCKGETEVVFWR